MEKSKEQALLLAILGAVTSPFPTLYVISLRELVFELYCLLGSFLMLASMLSLMISAVLGRDLQRTRGWLNEGYLSSFIILSSWLVSFYLFYLSFRDWT